MTEISQNLSQALGVCVRYRISQLQYPEGTISSRSLLARVEVVREALSDAELRIVDGVLAEVAWQYVLRLDPMVTELRTAILRREADGVLRTLTCEELRLVLELAALEIRG